MWLWSVLWQASGLLLVTGTLNFGFSHQRQFVPQALHTSHMNCYEYSKLDTHRFGRSYNEEWRYRKPTAKIKIPDFYSTSYPNVQNANQMMSRRLDKIFPKEDDLVKEHAKLVQDINSLKQVVFIAPIEDTRDVLYDDSIFHEVFETPTSTTLRPTTPRLTTRALRPIKTSFPIIYLGGESTRQVVRSPPLSFPKSISLVGTTTTPLLKHPYPFVTQGPFDKPLRVCMPSLPPYPATTKRPTLWERLVNAILPKPR